jgi:hypothetical protein
MNTEWVRICNILVCFSLVSGYAVTKPSFEQSTLWIQVVLRCCCSNPFGFLGYLTKLYQLLNWMQYVARDSRMLIPVKKDRCFINFFNFHFHLEMTFTSTGIWILLLGAPSLPSLFTGRRDLWYCDLSSFSSDLIFVFVSSSRIWRSWNKLQYTRFANVYGKRKWSLSR